MKLKIEKINKGFKKKRKLKYDYFLDTGIHLQKPIDETEHGLLVGLTREELIEFRNKIDSILKNLN